MSPGTLVFRIAVIAFLAWTFYKAGRTFYHYVHRRTLRRSGYTVKGTVVSVATVPNLNTRNPLVKVHCRIRYTANDGQSHETRFTTSYTQARVPRMGDVTDVYVNPANPADAEAHRYPTPPHA